MKHIDKLFKEKLYNHEVAVPEGMWEKIAPIAEEESGRAILWFWFAGLLALLLGGYGIYKMVNTNTTTPDPSTLVQKDETTIQNTDLIVDNSLSQESTSEVKEISVEEIEAKLSSVEVNNSENSITPAKEKISKDIISAVSSIDVKNQSITRSTTQNISNTVEGISNAVGTPANLVITKSYINKAGSIIKQSNFTDVSGSESLVYNVVLHSEDKDLNVGALLRLIEPLENIPLPAFQKELKKKTCQYFIL